MKINVEKIKLLLSLIIVLMIPILFGFIIPEVAKAIFYSISLSLKAILTFILPFIIFSFIFSCLLSLKTDVFKLVVLLISCVFISNYSAILTGYFVGSFFANKLAVLSMMTIEENNLLQPLWTLRIPELVPNQFALMLGFFLGIIFSMKKYNSVESFAQKLNKCANLFLKKIFIPIIPLFILGFVFKLEHDQLLTKALKMYGPFFFVVVGTQISYVIFLYSLASGFDLKKTFFFIKNVLPATLTGITTISSAATMPMLMVCSEKNTDAQFVKTIIPSTINIHTIGSAIGLTILSIATSKMFGIEISSEKFINFAFYYALAKYAVAAVPGGVIIVVVPLLEQYLGFSPDMIGLITAMYMLFDPFGTATNVTANGAFVLIFEKIYYSFSKRKIEKVDV